MKRILSLVLVLAMLASTAVVLSACGFKPDESLIGKYTYNTYASTFPSTWNPHTYQTATDSVILDYTSVGFYTFDYNDTKDGFVVVPEMAVGMPEDVSADYADTADEEKGWDIMEGDEARAWKITLRSDLKWEDGTPITAHDFVTSAQLLLNPDADNYRADSLYSGDMEIMGAKDYFYQGEEDYFTATQIYSKMSDDLDSKLVWKLGPGTEEIGALSYIRGTWAGFPDSYTLEMTVNWLIANYDFPVTVAQAERMEEKTLAEIKADAELKEAYEAALAWWSDSPDYALHFLVTKYAYPEKSWDEVGVKALSDTELVIILTSELSGFYLNYNLTGSWLVKEDIYRACEKYENGVYSNTYGTSKETFMSYGPYKIDSFQMDKQWVLSKNENWYGHSDHPELYQTTHVVCDWIEKPETAMLAFLQGNLDSKGLDANQSGDYLGSEHLYYSEGASTFFIALNPNESAFAEWEEKNPGNQDKSILGIKEFRMALSFSLDRTAFLAACDPTGSVAYSVFNNQICSDPETGTMYRTTEQAKDTLLKFWNISQEDIGAGKKFATKDEAIASITGYNLAAAKELFDQAYDQAIAEGLMSADDKVFINIGTPNATSAFYVNGYEFLVNNYTDAVKGTKLEGKLEFTNTNTLGNDFADALRANTVDMLFGVGWQGSALNPYGLIGAYTYDQYQYDPSWDTSKATMDFEIDGKTYRASVLAWTETCESGKDIEIVEIDADGNAVGEPMNYSCGLNDNKPEERLRLLAALENAVLQNYSMIPLNNDAGVSLKGMQIKYYTEEEVYGLGRGGIKYMTYNMDDYDWAIFVHDNGGTLNYK